MKAWLQSSDLSSKDMVLDHNSAFDALASHDWSSEEFRMAELERQGLENCPAGLGLISDIGYILHICPGSKEILIHYHYSSRALGFLWNNKKYKTLVRTNLDQTKKYILAFFDENWKLFDNAT